MSSRYVLELQRIYGVHGSEHTGYPHTALNIGSPNTSIRPSIQFLSDESSTASSVGATTREEFGGQKSLYFVASGEISKGTTCVQGKKSNLLNSSNFFNVYNNVMK